jgi:large subunit ribosomal protein L13
MQRKTYSQKGNDVERKWIVIDASENTIGRVAGVAADYLIGKSKPTYTPHIDGGDFVIIINAANVQVTGNKLEQKSYYNYSGFPGGLRERTLSDVLKKNPTAVLESAVRGMLPKNKLQDPRLARLKIFAGAEHNHEAQKPTKIGVKNG